MRLAAIHQYTTFDKVILGLHITSVLVAFGVLFAYPLLMVVGSRLDPSAMPWFHQMQQAISRRLVSPGLVLIVVFGVILASELHAWKAFYVQWGIGVSIVLGALEGLFMIPRTGRLAEIARRDLGGDGGAGGPVAAPPALGASYRSAFRQVLVGTSVICLLVVITVFFMAAHIGA